MNPPTRTLETTLRSVGVRTRSRDVSMKVGWCVNVPSDIA